MFALRHRFCLLLAQFFLLLDTGLCLLLDTKLCLFLCFVLSAIKLGFCLVIHTGLSAQYCKLSV